MRATAALVGAIGLAGCGEAPPAPPVTGPGPAPSTPPSGNATDAGTVPEAAAPATNADAAAEGGGAGSGSGSGSGSDAGAEARKPCPDDMALVDVSFCPRIERRCLREEYNAPNHITICHEFARAERCLAAEEHRRFCIDRYEYPNREGAHPPWMVSWYDAQATCRSKGRRLCWESEWVAACEGPDRSPFPYGLSRDPSKCNIDNTWIEPRLRLAYSKDPAVARRELSRLDQSVPSGKMAGCVSGFGVHDLTGNFDEWVTSDRPPEDKSQWAALKGGAWGHVRNACRPYTTSHPPDFTYYFISFRCCADAADAPVYVPKAGAPAPDVAPADRAPPPDPVGAPGPSRRKVAPDFSKKPPARGARGR